MEIEREPIIDLSEINEIEWCDVAIGIFKASIFIGCAAGIIFIKEKQYSNYWLLLPITIACLYGIYLTYRFKLAIDTIVDKSRAFTGRGMIDMHEEMMLEIKKLSEKIDNKFSNQTIINLPNSDMEDFEIDRLELLRD